MHKHLRSFTVKLIVVAAAMSVSTGAFADYSGFFHCLDDFVDMDTDGSESLTVEELEGSACAEVANDAAAYFDQIDEDDDGLISASEWLRACSFGLLG